jgi:protein ImuA
MASRADRERTIADLRTQIGRLERGSRLAARRHTFLPFDVPDLDRRLPEGGLPLGALHEVVPGGRATEHGAACVLFVSGILARLKGPVLWCLTSRDLFAPALARVGLHPDRVLYAETWRDAEVLPVMEEGVRVPGLAGVVGEASRVSLIASRRLQLAAETTGVTAFVLRRWRKDADPIGNGAGEGSAAVTRWRVTALPSAALPTPGLGRPCWRVELTHCRGAPAGSDLCGWTLEGCDEAGRLGLSAHLADGSRPQAPEERAATG